MLARENYETLTQYGRGGLFAHVQSRVRFVAACKSLCCLAYISSKDGLQDDACKHYEEAFKLAKPNDNDSDLQILLIWASQLLVRMHLQDDRCCEAIKVLTEALTPGKGSWKKMMVPSQENRTLLLAAYLELAYLCNRTGIHSDAAFLVKMFVSDFEHIYRSEALDLWAELLLELCIAKIGSIATPKWDTPQHVTALQRDL